MKTLILVRHAKSSWDNLRVSDFERSLNQRGEMDAPRMALLLKHLGVIPQYIISSPAKRALTTARIFSETLLDDSVPDTDNSIYEASVNELMHVLRQMDDQYESVMLVGHNPAITDLHNILVADKIENMPTCGVSVIELGIHNWQKLGEYSGRLLKFEYPKKHQDI